MKDLFLNSGNKTREQQEVTVEEVLDDENKIILYNDDVNTFDHVIESLMDVCDHNMVQAEQCSLIVHFKGKCDVKHGSFDNLRPMCEALQDRGLSATIE
jgi:ATP-dependent Clp protease adaptor protein ClpS